MTANTEQLRITEQHNGKILEIHVSGKLEQADYDRFVPEIERSIQLHGKIRMLLYLNNFRGWSASALWNDLKFDLKHFNDIERLAIVGESKWQEGMAAFCKPFTTAEVKYFDHHQLPDARQWVEVGLVHV